MIQGRWISRIGILWIDDISYDILLGSGEVGTGIFWQVFTPVIPTLPCWLEWSNLMIVYIEARDPKSLFITLSLIENKKIDPGWTSGQPILLVWS